jgi:PAS domain S-box-containing protein
MADSIGQVFWLRSLEGKVLYASPAFAKIWGLLPFSAEDTHQAWLHGIHPDDRGQVAAALTNARNQEQMTCEYRVVRPDGTIRWIWEQGLVVREDGREPTKWVGVAEDITALRDAQVRLVQAERLAAIGEAISGLAHESRNALQRSQSCLEMLSKRTSNRPDEAGLTVRIQEALRDLARLYERVRNYAAPVQLEHKSSDLITIWRRTCDDLSCMIQERGASIQEYSPNGSDCTLGSFDELALRQVFRNVLENSLSEDLDRAKSRDQVVVNVGWEATELKGDPAVTMSISDNGPGVNPEECRKIFEPFHSSKTRGTGLGLAISRRLVEAHGGTMDAASTPGNGLTIRITLPRKAHNAQPSQNRGGR